MKRHIAAAILVFSSGFVQISAAQEIDNCADAVEQSTSNEHLIEGYPRQQRIVPNEIVVGMSEPCLDIVVYQDRDLDYRVPDAKLSVSGLWVRVGQKRVAKDNSEPDEYEYGNSLGITEEIAAEASIGLATSVTGGVSFFGLVGAEATVEASIGFALTIARGTETAQEWSHSTMVNPGEEVQLWTRAMRVQTEWTPKKYAFSVNGLDPFASAQLFVKEIYLPSYKAFFMRNDMTEKAAEAALVPIGMALVANWPPTNETDLAFAANALKLLNGFLEDHREGFKSEFLLPYNEVYTSRYKF